MATKQACKVFYSSKFVVLVRPSDDISKLVESKIVTGPNLEYKGPLNKSKSVQKDKENNPPDTTDTDTDSEELTSTESITSYYLMYLTFRGVASIGLRGFEPPEMHCFFHSQWMLAVQKNCYLSLQKW